MLHFLFRSQNLFWILTFILNVGCGVDDKIGIDSWSWGRSAMPCPPLSLCFIDHFPGEPTLDGYIGAKDDGSGGDNWSYKTCKAPVASSPPTNQHPAFYRPDALPVAKPAASKHWREMPCPTCRKTSCETNSLCIISASQEKSLIDQRLETFCRCCDRWSHHGRNRRKLSDGLQQHVGPTYSSAPWGVHRQ